MRYGYHLVKDILLNVVGVDQFCELIGHGNRQCFSTNGQWYWSCDGRNSTSTHGIGQRALELDRVHFNYG